MRHSQIGVHYISKYGHSSYSRRHLLQKIQPFCTYAEFELCKARRVAAWPRQIGDIARTDWVGRLREHDRYAAGRFQQRRDNRARSGKDDLRTMCNEFDRVPAEELRIASAPADLNMNVATVGPAQLLQLLHECGQAGGGLWVIHRQIHEHSDSPQRRLLRARRKRPCRGRAGEKPDEIAPSKHSITSSAISCWGAYAVVAASYRPPRPRTASI